MRITFQPSGGRGEYEVSDYAPNGLRPTDVLGAQVKLLLGKIMLDTGVVLTKDQGKYRLRVIPKGAHPQVPIQLAHILMLPYPTRQEDHMGSGELVLQNNSYIIKNIQFGEVVPSGGSPPSSFTAEVLTVDCRNQTIEAEQIAVLKRMADIELIWQRKEHFPSDIGNLLAQHEAYIKAGRPIPTTVDGLIKNVQRQVERYSTELEIPYTSTTDVVPALLAALGEIAEERPVSLDQIEPEQVTLRLRERIKWQVWARRRGAASIRFRKEVRTAYHSRCVMCGGCFPATSVNDKPGVDAAHILPWADYDLDELYNGVCLCKLHHWAFDEGILLIVFREGKYYIELSERADRLLSGSEFSIDMLRRVVGEIPEDRLPSKPANWPNRILLARRNEEFILVQPDYPLL